MHILLINTNPVVSRLISLCAREDHMNLEEIDNMVNVARDKYDIIFIDDASYVDETEELLSNLLIRKKVFLSSSDKVNEEVRLFDSIIKKPFLPSQITDELESLEEDDTLKVATDTPFIFPLSSDEESVDETLKENEQTGSEVLNVNEIEKIKALLNMGEGEEEINEEEYESRKIEVIKQQLIADGLEIVDEDEYVETLSKKKQKNKKVKKEDKENFTFEEVLLAAVEGMKVKKIKKLLKGAEVMIKINFKDKE